MGKADSRTVLRLYSQRWIKRVVARQSIPEGMMRRGKKVAGRGGEKDEASVASSEIFNR